MQDQRGVPNRLLAGWYKQLEPQKKEKRQVDTDRCGNCHTLLEPDQKFCPWCGTRRGEGRFEPYRTLQGCIYGPKPILRRYKCMECGNEWSRHNMKNDQRYCPRCGCGAVKMTEEEDS